MCGHSRRRSSGPSRATAGRASAHRTSARLDSGNRRPINADPSHPGGPRFVGLYMRLLCDHIPTFSVNALIAAANNEGVDTTLTVQSTLDALGPDPMTMRLH